MVMKEVITTGFNELDNLLTGLYGGDLIVVGGRPAMGKTHFALDIVNHVAIGKNIPCLFYSIESTKKQVERVLTYIGGDETYEKLRNFQAPIHVEDDVTITTAEFYSMAREYKEEYDIGLIVIDYFQILIGYQIPELGKRAISEAMADLKKLAMDLDVPVLVLTQLDRRLEKREDKRPTLSDLKGSEPICSEADVVILLYRDDYYYSPEETTNPNTAEIIVAKNCNGETGTVELGFSKGRFYERS